MSVRVQRPGLLTTIQDRGRRGWQRYGVVVGGAMDVFSLRIANSLVGNADEAAALEITLLGPTLQFQAPALIAVCGGEWSPQVAGTAVPTHRPVWLPAGATLALGSARSGCRGYLAIAGGIDVPPVMGSRSTDLRARFGGADGRGLQSGDELKLGSLSPLARRIAAELSPSGALGSVCWGAAVWPAGEDRVVRFVRGADFEKLTSESQQLLFNSDFSVTADSDRMGYRLAGAVLSLCRPIELISAAVCPGTIQLPPEGLPILLMADAATTGGYPILAHVASAELPRVGQLRPGDSFRLDEISLAEAHNLYCQQEAALRCLQTNLRLKFAL